MNAAPGTFNQGGALSPMLAARVAVIVAAAPAALAVAYVAADGPAALLVAAGVLALIGQTAQDEVWLRAGQAVSQS